MKAIKFFSIIGALLFIMASCVENSQKYKNVIFQRDSLALVKQVLDSNYNQTLVLLDDIQIGFSKINEDQRQMKVDLKGVEGSKASRRDIIAAQMTSIKENLDRNKAKIAELQRLAAKRGTENSTLNETIKRLQLEMEEKVVQIQALQAELEQKNIRINELSSTVDIQAKNIAEQQSLMDEQKYKINAQDKDINTVWYCVATSKKLKELKIITSVGLFQPKKVLDNEFDKTAFTQVDLRTALSIPTYSKKVTLLSLHPINSYKLTVGTDKLITIDIVNSTQFWSVSKYLVVQI